MKKLNTVIGSIAVVAFAFTSSFAFAGNIERPNKEPSYVKQDGSISEHKADFATKPSTKGMSDKRPNREPVYIQQNVVNNTDFKSTQVKSTYSSDYKRPNREPVFIKNDKVSVQ